MDIKAIATTRLDWTGDLLAIGFYEDAVELTGDLAALNLKLAGIIETLIAETEFKGAKSSSAVTRVGVNSSVAKIMLVGLGKAEGVKLDTLRKAGATIARAAKREKAKTLGISLPVWNGDSATTAQVISEGLLLALHQDNRFKSEVEPKNQLKLTEVHLLDFAGNDAAISKAQAIADGVILARELVAAPANGLRQ
jgi:leucyl aminopeptidase